MLNFQGFLRRLSDACTALGAYAREWDLTAEQRQAFDHLVENKVQPSIQILERNARRMERLLAALLELSRAGREPVHWARVDATEAAREVVEELCSEAAGKSATLRLDALPELWVDPNRLRQILRHLAGNALKFLSADRPGEITLGGLAQDGEVVIWVRDNGIGLRPQDQERIFLPFGRVQEIETPGEGIGLATVRKLAGQQGGRAWVESTHRLGSTFYLAFPAQPPGNKT
ncbi:MAG: hypothetical protein HY238_11930 [Acidobacteria bacterium]|nr:hypothetical protein [Acidobacteriota bacterium]